MEFRLLGPVGVWMDGQRLGPTTAQQRCVLAILMLAPGKVVSIEKLVIALWGEQPPESARNAVQGYVSRLRRLLTAVPGVALITSGSGYCLGFNVELLDVHRFRGLVAEAGRSEPSEAAGLLRAALALWRGPALADVAGAQLAAVTGEALEEERIAALEERAEVDIQLGRHHETVAELSVLVAQHPLRERSVGLLMSALSRCGRRAEALATFRAARERFVDELGIEPQAELQRLHLQILASQDAPASEIAAPAAVPRQLPTDVAVFAGRGEQLSYLDGLFQPGAGPPAGIVSPIIMIVGMAGVGKTALAVHWAHRAAASFPDGQLYVNLRGFGPDRAAMTPGAVLRIFLGALAVPREQIPTDLSEQSSLYRSVLSRRRMLIVLDNARDTEQVRPLLPGLDGCLTLITSRNQLGGLVAAEGAQPLMLDGFTAGVARDLLSRRLGAPRVAAEPQAVAEIIMWCAGLPLALTVAGARAAMHPHFPLASLAQDLGSAAGRLDELHVVDEAADVRTVFSWSYRGLSPAAARLFRLLGLHSGPDITTPAAASLAGLPLARTRRLLTELAGAHLIAEYSPSRYTLHDLLRAYAAELGHTLDPAAQRDKAVRRVVDHYLHTAHLSSLSRWAPITLGPLHPGVTPETDIQPAQVMAWFAAEHATLLATFAQAIEYGLDTQAWQLAASLRTYLDRSGHWQEWADVNRAAITAASRIADRTGQAHAHSDLAGAYTRLGHHEDADTHFRQALALFDQLGDINGHAHTRGGLAWLFEQQGRYRQALAQVQQAADLYNAAGNRAGRASALNGVGWYHAMLGEYTSALLYCEQALAAMRELGQRRGMALTWSSLGHIRHHLGHHEAAVASYQTAIDLFHEFGDRYREADTLAELADIYHAIGNNTEAKHLWCQSLRIFVELGHPDADRIRARLDPAP